jgi:indolepyruvate ferredoxin oxidoreductase alpha subunit
MAERSFKKEIALLRLKEGEMFQGEGILAVAKGLLQSGVSYVGAYQGAPISHLADVMNDADEVRDELGIHFENCASEAGAAAMLGASIHYPLRGAVTWKSTVGTNVASDALANVASSGVKGGALIVIGEDYGEGSSIMQERTHAFAMKSQIWLLDPRPELSAIVDAVETGFQLSEASNTPVMLTLRIRACHVYGSFEAKNNVKARYNTGEGLPEPVYDYSKMVLPPSSFEHEVLKIEKRWPEAVKFITEKGLNEFMDGDIGSMGIILQGGLYNSVIRALQLLGLADDFGNSKIPLYVLNVTYPLIPDEVSRFCADKEAVLLVEEGQPNYIEQALNTILRKADLQTRLYGKDLLPEAGEYKTNVIMEGLSAFIEAASPPGVDLSDAVARKAAQDKAIAVSAKAVAFAVPNRSPGFCVGCPERPVFSAIKILEEEIGATHVCGDIGCNLFGTLPPFNLGQHTMGYGLGLASSTGIAPNFQKRVISIMGDGGFWHNGLTTGVANAVYNNNDSVLVIFENGYAAATGHQAVPSSDAHPDGHATGMTIQSALRGVGVKWIREVNNYQVDQVVSAVREAMTTPTGGVKCIIAKAECMLAKQRKVKRINATALNKGERVERSRFGVDEDVCTGDHACIRLSGCPSLTIKDNPDPLMDDPVAHIDNSCVGCGNCGSVSHEAGLCPSFFRADIVQNPSAWEKWMAGLRGSIIDLLQREKV